VDDLKTFLTHYKGDVFPMGVGSNLIVRDGGLDAVVIRLGRGFNHINIDANTVTCGPAALDAHVARKAADAGLDLTFLRTIPGAIGGGISMNAGCYGAYMADVLVSCDVLLRNGERVTLTNADLQFGYRSSKLPEGAVIIEATLKAERGDPEDLHNRMESQLKKRDETQPTKDRTAGSTFRNPAGFSSTGRADDTHDLKAWKLIDDAGLRGKMLGKAQMSPKHPNFLINTGGATAADLEDLGELVRKEVLKTSGIELQWEVLRIGKRLTD
jgi:UDP-N-acetylmuramate dehydrogenase